MQVVYQCTRCYSTVYSRHYTSLDVGVSALCAVTPATPIGRGLLSLVGRRPVLHQRIRMIRRCRARVLRRRRCVVVKQPAAEPVDHL